MHVIWLRTRVIRVRRIRRSKLDPLTPSGLVKILRARSTLGKPFDFYSVYGLNHAPQAPFEAANCECECGA